MTTGKRTLLQTKTCTITTLSLRAPQTELVKILLDGWPPYIGQWTYTCSLVDFSSTFPIPDIWV